MDELLSLIQAVSYRHIASSTLYNLIRECELRTVQVLGRRLIQSLSSALRPGSVRPGFHALEGLPGLVRQVWR